MSALTLCLIIFAAMLVLMAIRVPISVAMFTAGTLGYLLQTGWAVLKLSQQPSVCKVCKLRLVGHSFVHIDGSLCNQRGH